MRAIDQYSVCECLRRSGHTPGLPHISTLRPNNKTLHKWLTSDSQVGWVDDTKDMALTFFQIKWEPRWPAKSVRVKNVVHSCGSIYQHSINKNMKIWVFNQWVWLFLSVFICFFSSPSLLHLRMEGPWIQRAATWEVSVPGKVEEMTLAASP